MGRILKALILLIVLVFVALVGFAYVGDLSPVLQDQVEPVLLNVD